MTRIARAALLSTSLVLGSGGAAPRLAAQDRPHVVVILADDLGWGDPQCYAPDSLIPTPHLDALAAAGLRCTDAHSPSSVCTPTRYALLTGRYAWRGRLEKQVLWAWDPPLLEDERVTLPEFLREAGYRTACIGKWHLGWHWPLVGGGWSSDGHDGPHVTAEAREAIAASLDWDRPLGGGPLAHGFESYFGDDVPNFPPYTFLRDDRPVVRPTVDKPGEMFGVAGPAAPAWDLTVVMPRLVQEACAWLDEHARSPRATEPFFLFLPLTAPHTPIAPSGHYDGLSEAGPYGDYVAQVDAVVGHVRAALVRNGLEDDTLLVFSSDNGSPARHGGSMNGPIGSVISKFGHQPSGPWRGLKGDAWEGGHRVPLLVRWPGHVDEGRVSDHPVVLTDLYRTIARLVGHEVGEAAGEDSFDVGPEWFGLDHVGPPRATMIHHSQHGVFAYRRGRFKLILDPGSGGFSQEALPEDAPEGQLYDLELDPGETDNLWRDEPELVEMLKAELQAIRRAGRS